jgi:serine/threonine-protein kinase RsbW
MREIKLCFNDMSMYVYFRDGIGALLKDIFPNEHTMIEIATNEAINNAFNHGAQSSLNPFIQMKISMIDEEKLYIRIKDSGNGFKLNMIKEQQLGEQIMSESGRGIQIMNCVFDEIHYNTCGNEVTMIKKLDKSEDILDV